MTLPTLLPRNTTPLERVLEQVLGPAEVLTDAADLITNIQGTRPSAFYEALVHHYAVGQLRPFVALPQNLIDYGRQWQLVRGTYAGVALGLSFLSTVADIDPALWRRLWWNSFQLRLSAIPFIDVPLLDRIEQITDLSAPFRSDFRRGVCGYDAYPGEYAETRFGATLWGDESGVRLRPDGPLWSFGRETSLTHTLTQPEGTALGMWIPFATPGNYPGWSNIEAPWEDAEFAWDALATSVRAITMASFFEEDCTVHFCLRAPGGDVIGYRRARAARRVKQNPGGQYTVNGVDYEIDPAGEFLIMEALTGFGDGVGSTVGQVSMIINGLPDPSIPAGRRWYLPGQLTGGVEIALKTLAVPARILLRPTVRQRINYTLRF